MKNILNREIPEFIEGYGKTREYKGPFAHLEPCCNTGNTEKPRKPGENKILKNIADAIDKAGLKDGMTVSFHHHLRNGDQVINQVMAEVEKKGIKDICLAASGIFAVHEPLVALIEKGVITKIVTDTFNVGPVPRAISEGKLKYPCVFMTHGGRPRAIMSGDLHIDVAFIAAPTSDERGNLNGTEGKSACGYISYAYPDAQYADTVVAITDNLVPYPACPIEIGEQLVDYVVCVESIGSSAGIESGTTQMTSDETKLKIADDTVRLLDELGAIRNDMSFQTGASSISLAVAAGVRDRMLEKKIVGSFALGGIHAYMVKMLEEGLFRALLDTQCFDLSAVESAKKNKSHMAIGASQYANPMTSGPVVNNLDTVILGATEIDTDFNVNVITGSNGVIMGASGGHSDCAAGAKLTVVVANLTRKKFCIIRDKITTITTPGSTVDVLVTEDGIAINPKRQDLIKKLQGSKLPLVDIRDLKKIGEDRVGVQGSAEVSDKIVGVVEYRDGTVIDILYQIK